jgi:beta-glucosidase-like glycosyl hydrolase
MPFCDASLDVESRITDAISRMTLDDKIAALSTSWNPIAGLGLPSYDWWSEATHGVSYYRVDKKTPFSTNFAFPITTAMSFNRSLWKATASQIAHEV